MVKRKGLKTMPDDDLDMPDGFDYSDIEVTREEYEHLKILAQDPTETAAIFAVKCVESGLVTLTE